MPIDPKVRERLKEASRRMGIVRLIRQLRVAEQRIRTEFARLIESAALDPTEEWTLIEELTLDLETYYTVAFDLLKLAASLLPEHRRAPLRSDKTYKRIAVLRNQRTRHAYDKPDGIHDSGINWNENSGPSLHTTASHGISDPGFFVNWKNLDDLIIEYDITHLYTDPPLVVLRDATKKGIKVRICF